MKMIGYTYEADFHCPEHTALRFPVDEHGLSNGIDSEGNEIRALYDTDISDIEPDKFPASNACCVECMEAVKSLMLKQLWEEMNYGKD